MEGGSAYRVQLLLERHHVLAASEGWNVGVRGDISLVGLGEAGGLRGWVEWRWTAGDDDDESAEPLRKKLIVGLETQVRRSSAGVRVIPRMSEERMDGNRTGRGETQDEDGGRGGGWD